jgi:GTP:adenosylcobinamide-phosphate guanylyltransferase
MIMKFDMDNWYWLVSDGNAQRVYSSAGNGYVPVTDATYTAWLAAGGKPSVIVSADLAQLMNARIDSAISELESGTLRALRDLAAGNGTIATNGVTPVQRLAAAETAIAALRASRL